MEFRRWFMPRRKDWNKMGPRLPYWFIWGIRRIDRRLVLQFVPPTTVDPAGLPASRFPGGAWWICARTRRSRRWLSKRPVYVMGTSDGGLIQPTRQLLKMLAIARRLRRASRLDELENQFQEQIDSLQREEAAASKDALMERIANTMRRMNMRAHLGSPRLFMGGHAIPASD